MRNFSLLIFDLDNTIYDWYAAFLPAFYAMVSAASKILRCDTEVLLDELRQVHIKHHDVEHPFSLIETKSVQKMIENKGADQVWRQLDPAFHAFNRIRKENLCLFPGTRETLSALTERGIRLAAYTDSTYFAASGRINRLSISDLFDKVYCRERGNSVLPPLSGNVAIHLSDKIVEIPSHKSKPNPQVLAEIVAEQNLQVSDVGYVGDSIAKDVLMAKRAGCFAIWAKYGAHTDREMYESLVRIPHWTQEDIEREKNYAHEAIGLQPDFICEHSLNEVLEFAYGPNVNSHRRFS